MAKFKQFCTDAMVHLKTKFEWKNVAEHVHEVLAHIWVAIETNGGYGLGPYSEVSVSCSVATKPSEVLNFCKVSKSFSFLHF